MRGAVSAVKDVFLDAEHAAKYKHFAPFVRSNSGVLPPKALRDAYESDIAIALHRELVAPLEARIAELEARLADVMLVEVAE